MGTDSNSHVRLGNGGSSDSRTAENISSYMAREVVDIQAGSKAKKNGQVDFSTGAIDETSSQESTSQESAASRALYRFMASFHCLTLQ